MAYVNIEEILKEHERHVRAALVETIKAIAPALEIDEVAIANAFHGNLRRRLSGFQRVRDRSVKGD